MTITEERDPASATQSLVSRPSELSFTGQPNAMIGQRYRLGTLLGKGGVGRVWLALDERLDRAVALKEVPHDRAHFGGSALAEARAAARICDAGVVRIFDFVTTADRETDWIVMEALSGESLASAVKRSGPIQTDEARFIGRHLLTALAAVHRSGLVHGDIKPGNIQLCADGRVVLLDFGLTAAPRIESGSTHGLIMGTPAFLAPEVLDHGHYSPASDLYALGMALYRATDGGGELSPLIAGLLHPNPQKRWDIARCGDFLTD